MSNLSQRVGFETERTSSGPFSGSYAKIGTVLANNPVIVIFDNQSTVTVSVSVDGTNTWHTFPSGEALLLDLRANNGVAPNYTIDAGTQFWVNGTAGTGSFSISILYAM